jgi:hypothetical protein
MIEQIVPKKSAVFGLPGDLENQVGIDAGHSDMCRFDRNNSKDMDNFEFVQGNIQELYDIAMERNGEFLDLPLSPEADLQARLESLGQ